MNSGVNITPVVQIELRERPEEPVPCRQTCPDPAQVGVLAEPEDGEIVIGRGVKVEVVAVPDGSGRRQPRTKPQLP